MLTIMFMVAMIYVAGKMLVWGLKATWGIMKFICTVILLPLFIVGLFFMGFIYLAIPILIIAGIVAIVGGLATS